MNKKGDLSGLVFFIAAITVFAFFIIIVGYIGITVSDQLKTNMNSSSPDHQTQIDRAFDKTTDISKVSLNAIWYVIFAGLVISLMITSFFVRTHPIFAPVFIILLIVAVTVGVALSNAYEEVYAVTQFGDITPWQQGVAFFMGKLPYIALIVGLISLIITFAKPDGVGSGGVPLG